jgi:hypothetical protein
MGEDVRVRQTVKYTDYKKFGSNSTIIYNGEDISTKPDAKKPEDKKPQ